MAERSHVGPGRLVEPPEIVAAVLRLRDLESVPVLVTAGPTREHLDPVRFLSNPSSGKMGYALAEAAADRGAQVTLVSGPTALPGVHGVHLVHVESADDLARAVDRFVQNVRVVIMAAAVADQKPVHRSSQKAKKTEGKEVLELVRTPDILAGLGARKDRPLLVGFAAETENVEQNAADKLKRKNLDLIVANDVTAAFSKETNRVVVLTKDGVRTEVSGTKIAVAHAIWDMVRARL
jgi:phosphopantothenoylcysteine decarboxylase/phosphopantothenate--cysteine ligase